MAFAASIIDLNPEVVERKDKCYIYYSNDPNYDVWNKYEMPDKLGLGELHYTNNTYFLISCTSVYYTTNIVDPSSWVKIDIPDVTLDYPQCKIYYYNEVYICVPLLKKIFVYIDLNNNSCSTISIEWMITSVYINEDGSFVMAAFGFPLLKGSNILTVNNNVVEFQWRKVGEEDDQIREIQKANGNYILFTICDILYWDSDTEHTTHRICENTGFMIANRIGTFGNSVLFEAFGTKEIDGVIVISTDVYKKLIINDGSLMNPEDYYVIDIPIVYDSGNSCAIVNNELVGITYTSETDNTYLIRSISFKDGDNAVKLPIVLNDNVVISNDCRTKNITTEVLKSETANVDTLKTSTINTTKSLKITSDVNEGWGHVVDLYAPNTSNGNTAILNFGKEDKYGCSAHIGFKYNETNKDNSSFIIGLHSHDNIIEVNKTTMTSKVNIDCPNIQCDTINGMHFNIDGATTKCPHIPVVQQSGCMEIGRMIDFHTYTAEGEISSANYDCRLWWNHNGNDKLQCTKPFTAPNISASFTVTHETGSSDTTLTPGTYCETDGTIYEQFKDNIKVDDCICNIKQATSLNNNIVGITTSTDPPKFATHGDVLIKVLPNDTYNIGDIIVPGENGYGKKGSDEEIMQCVLHRIPTAKIISLETDIPNQVACLLL